MSLFGLIEKRFAKYFQPAFSAGEHFMIARLAWDKSAW
jgi:hypothetical protein